MPLWAREPVESPADDASMSTTTDDDASDTALGLAPTEVENDEETAVLPLQ